MVDRPIRVLHVEDNEFFATVASDVLENEHGDVTVVTADSATEALDRLDWGRFDCVVSDYEMPGMDGLELLDEVRDAQPDLPFILLTGGGSEEIASEAISAGVTDYFQKQAGKRQFAVLANRIENAVSRRRAEKAASRQIDVNDVIWDGSQALLEASSREEIERAVCERLAESNAYRSVWVGRVDSETDRVHPQASAGVDESSLDAITVATAGNGTDRGPADRAVTTRTVQVEQRVADRGEFERGRASVSDHRSYAVVPLVYETKLYGVLSVHADRRHAFGEAECHVLSKFGKNVAHTISSVKTGQALLRREQRLQVFNRILRHNLRNDLNVVVGHAENILEANPETEPEVETIRRKASELIEISEKARQVGKTIERDEWSETQVEIGGVVERACQDIARTHDAPIARDTPDATWVYADRSLGAAIGEILENAIEHNDRERAVVDVSMTATESDGESWVELSVADNGPGIPDEELAVLRQGEETALEHGSGLGLWFTNWIVSRFGGELTFDDNHPRGSVVTIRLRGGDHDGPD